MRLLAFVRQRAASLAKKQLAESTAKKASTRRKTGKKFANCEVFAGKLYSIQVYR